MRLSTKMRYGTRGMLDLALHFGQGPQSLASIAERQDLSVKYLENLLGALRVAALVRSLRGAQGGYELARHPRQITLRDLYEVLEGPEGFAPCTPPGPPCLRQDDCVTHDIWGQMFEAAMQVLSSTTLADLARQYTTRESAWQVMYEI